MPHSTTYVYGYDLVGNLTGDIAETYHTRASTTAPSPTAMTPSTGSLIGSGHQQRAQRHHHLRLRQRQQPHRQNHHRQWRRHATTYTYNNLNQPTGNTGTARVTSPWFTMPTATAPDRTVTGGTDNGTDTYSYDFENRLIKTRQGHHRQYAGTYAYTVRLPHAPHRPRRIQCRRRRHLTWYLAAAPRVQEYSGTNRQRNTRGRIHPGQRLRRRGRRHPLQPARRSSLLHPRKQARRRRRQNRRQRQPDLPGPIRSLRQTESPPPAPPSTAKNPTPRTPTPPASSTKGSATATSTPACSSPATPPGSSMAPTSTPTSSRIHGPSSIPRGWTARTLREMEGSLSQIMSHTLPRTQRQMQ